VSKSEGWPGSTGGEGRSGSGLRSVGNGSALSGETLEDPWARRKRTRAPRDPQPGLTRLHPTGDRRRRHRPAWRAPVGPPGVPRALPVPEEGSRAFGQLESSEPHGSGTLHLTRLPTSVSVPSAVTSCTVRRPVSPASASSSASWNTPPPSTSAAPPCPPSPRPGTPAPNAALPTMAERIHRLGFLWHAEMRTLDL